MPFVCIFLHKYCVHNYSYSFNRIDFKHSQMISHDVNVCKKVSFLACHISTTNYSPLFFHYYMLYRKKCCVHNSSYSLNGIDFKLSQVISHDMKLCKNVLFFSVWHLSQSCCPLFVSFFINLVCTTPPTVYIRLTTNFHR